MNSTIPERPDEARLVSPSVSSMHLFDIVLTANAYPQNGESFKDWWVELEPAGHDLVEMTVSIRNCDQ